MAELTITKDREELERLEGIIEENIGAFYRVGKALMKIRDEQLYSKVRGIENFETYCRDRWGFNSSRARQLIAATETADNIKSVTNSNTIESETHLRPLARLEPEAQREAWQKAVETAPQGKVTAAHVQKVVKTYQLKGGEVKEPERMGEWYDDGLKFCAMAIAQMERIHKKDIHREEAFTRMQTWLNKNR